MMFEHVPVRHFISSSYIRVRRSNTDQSDTITKTCATYTPVAWGADSGISQPYNASHPPLIPDMFVPQLRDITYSKDMYHNFVIT